MIYLCLNSLNKEQYHIVFSVFSSKHRPILSKYRFSRHNVSFDEEWTDVFSVTARKPVKKISKILMKVFLLSHLVKNI